MEDGLERKKEKSRKRSRAVRDNTRWAKKVGTSRQLTPGTTVVGYEFKDRQSKEEETTDSVNELKIAIAEYVLHKGGFRITEHIVIDTLPMKEEPDQVLKIYIAKIVGLHERWGLDRRFMKGPIYAFRLGKGTIIEYGLESYSVFMSRTYYIVKNSEFHAFLQHNYRNS